MTTAKQRARTRIGKLRQIRTTRSSMLWQLWRFATQATGAVIRHPHITPYINSCENPEMRCYRTQDVVECSLLYREEVAKVARIAFQNALNHYGPTLFASPSNNSCDERLRLHSFLSDAIEKHCTLDLDDDMKTEFLESMIVLLDESFSYKCES